MNENAIHDLCVINPHTWGWDMTDRGPLGQMLTRGADLASDGWGDGFIVHDGQHLVAVFPATNVRSDRAAFKVTAEDIVDYLAQNNIIGGDQ